MDAQKSLRYIKAFLVLSILVCSNPADVYSQAWPSGNGPLASVVGMARPQSTIRTQNFVIISSDPVFANQVAQAAEKQRHELATYWLGAPLPNWTQPCPITVVAGPRLGAGGSTTFTPGNGTIRNWRMNVSGSQERILDSVLPHEITHTILATHFAPMNKTVPRWADEGACTTVEHGSERSKHDQFLVRFLSSGRGIPFATMFTLKEYPSDIMPLYAQGYSVTSFLIAQGGPQQFVKFLEAGLSTDDWVMATETHYGYPMIGKLQTAWNKWVYDGGGDVARHTADALLVSKRSQLAASQPVRLASADTQKEVSINNTSEIASPNTSSSRDASWYRKQLDQTTRGVSQSNLSTSSQTIPAEPPSLGFASRPNQYEPLRENAQPSTKASPEKVTLMPEDDYSVGHQQSPQSLGSPIMSSETIGLPPSVSSGLSSGIPVGQSFFR